MVYVYIYDMNVYVYQFILYLVHFSNVAEGMCHELCFFFREEQTGNNGF